VSAPKASPELVGNLLATLFSFCVLALLFVLFEGGLRVAGIGARDASTSRLAYQQIHLPILREAARPDGTRVWVTADPRLPFQTILASKPATALRVVTFGGSATAGLGFSPNVTFARHLRGMLEEALPRREVEVLNLGIVALSSRQVKLLVADVCERYEPDVAVVYSGNNEFLEIHAEKYAAANRTRLASVADLVERSHVFRTLRLALYGRPKPPSLADRDFSPEDLRLTQARIIEDVELAPQEIQKIVDAYEANLDEVVDAATAHGTPLVLVSVASNWKWRGRSDLPADWMTDWMTDSMAEFVPRGEADGELDLAGLRGALEERVAAAPADERSGLLFRRAVVEERLGDFEAARASYRAAMNEDPHLRRALDVMNERVAAVAQRRKVTFLDAVATLAGDAEHGIVGFGQFYDYVHFTPRGAVVLAEALFQTLVSLGVVPADRLAVADAYRERQLRDLAELEQDPLELAEWLGVGFEPERGIADRDLWKFDRLLGEIDARIEADGGDIRARVYRANAHYFRIDGAARAEQDYRAALALLPDDPAIRDNLARLSAERPLASPARAPRP